MLHHGINRPLALAAALLLAATPSPAQQQSGKTTKTENTQNNRNELGETYDSSTKVGNGVKSDKHAGTNFSDEAAKRGVKIGGRANSTAKQQHGPATWFTRKADNSSTSDTGDTTTTTPEQTTVTTVTTTVADPWAEIRGFLNAQQFDKAAPLLQSKAEAGDVNAAYNLAVLYYNGQGVARDYSQAARWFEAAAGQYGAAAFNAANIYENGTGGVAKDTTKAIELYRKASQNGIDCTDALKRLGAE